MRPLRLASLLVPTLLATASCGTDPSARDTGPSSSTTTTTADESGSTSRTHSTSTIGGDETSTSTGADESGDTGRQPVCEVLAVAGVRAIGDDGNVPENVLDDDIETRWSFEGVGSWIELELPESIATSGLSVAWHRGDERRNTFGVEISTDGTTYVEVFRGWSTGRSSEEERYGFGFDTEARFVRLTFHGNTLNEWASILELRVNGAECEPWMQDIYLAIGQSNMAGRAPIEDDDRPAPDDVYLLGPDGGWELASNDPLGLNRHSTVEEAAANRTRLGPAYTFGRKVAAETGRPVGLVVNARGGTRIAQWAKVDHDGELPLYEEAVARTELALAANPGSTLRGIIWHQGEGDNNQQASASYVANIAEIVDGLRGDLDAPDAVFVAGEVGTWQGRGAYINPEIRRIPDVVPNASWVSSDGLTTHETTTDPWGPHFDSASQRTLGERYADEVLALLGALERPRGQ